MENERFLKCLDTINRHMTNIVQKDFTTLKEQKAFLERLNSPELFKLIVLKLFLLDLVVLSEEKLTINYKGMEAEYGGIQFPINIFYLPIFILTIENERTDPQIPKLLDIITDNKPLDLLNELLFEYKKIIKAK
jgi:hypothetical protein